MGMAYSIVNHEQSMRLFAAKQRVGHEDVGRRGRLAADRHHVFQSDDGHHGPGAVSQPRVVARRGVAAANGRRGLSDSGARFYHRSASKGIVIAGLLAAAISTYAGMGAAMSALLTRDVYARLIARDRDDAHYLRVGRWLTLAVMLGSFLYVPFLLEQGMMMFYLDLVAAFVIPLLTVYLMGVFTRVHRKSGTIGLLVGVAYGVWRLIASELATSTGIVHHAGVDAGQLRGLSDQPVDHGRHDARGVDGVGL